MRKTRLVRVVVWIAVLAAMAALVVLTRPGPGYQSPPSGAQIATGHAADPRPTETPGAAAETLETEPEAGVGGAEIVNPAASDGHGPRDVVRTRDFDIDEQHHKRRPRFEPDWSAPLTLTFASLRKYRREFRTQGDFSAETVRKLSGAAVVIKGAVMPIDPLPESGEMKRLWIANPMVVMAGCVFCTPPTLADIVYVQAPAREPYEADRERLYRSVVIAEARGRLVLGPVKGEDGVEYMFGLELTEIAD